MATYSRVLYVAALLLAAFVAIREVVYYVGHPNRSGPSITITLLAVAVILVAAAGLGKTRS